MWHWNVAMIKTNTLNLRTPICKVTCNKFLSIIIVAFINTWSNEWTENLLFIQVCILLVWEPKEGWHFCSCNIEKIKLLSRIFSEDPLNIHKCYLGWVVSMGDILQDVKSQVWLDQIWNKYLQYMSSGRSSLCIDLSWPCIFHV